MTSKKEKLKVSLAEFIYVSTIQPVKYTRLSSLFSSFYPYSSSLDETCEKLGYYSFNDYLRHNRHLFHSFLTIFACKNRDDDESRYVLYYHNAESDTNCPKILSGLFKEEYVEPDRTTIAYDESVFFESHNSLDIIDRRKEFVKLVEYCQTRGYTNANGMVPLHKINQAFHQKYGNEELSNKLKTWFPNRGGLENIVQKVFFEDLTFTLSDQANGKEMEFCLKEGWSEKKFDRLKCALQKLQDKLESGLYSKEYGERHENIPKTAFEIRFNNLVSSKQKKLGPFGDSSDEEDERVENTSFIEGPPRKYVPMSKKYALFDDVCQNDQLVAVSDRIEVVNKYDVNDDVGLEELCFDEPVMSEKKSTIEDDSASVSSALPASSETEHGCFGNSDEADEPPVNEKHKDESDKSVISQSSASSSLNEEVENDATVASEIIVAKADIPVEVTDATKATTVEAPIVQATVAEEGVNKVTSTLMNTDVEFYYPSSMDLKKCCEKFGVVYNRNAYAFWSNFEIGKISSTSIPDKLYSSANNGFVSLSLYLTGSEENASKIKETLNKYFFSNMKSLGNEMGYGILTRDHPKVYATLFPEALNDIHFLILTYLIDCRIGIFDGKNWTRYGTWNESDVNVLTFLFVAADGMYCPVLTLKD